jgi:aspartate kinase
MMTASSAVVQKDVLVMKFGGTSVGSAAAMRQAVQVCADARKDWPALVVVTSALSGVTDLLIQSARQAARGDLSVFERAWAELQERHYAQADALVTNPAELVRVCKEVDGLLADFRHLCQAIHILGEASPRSMDAVAALGERLSVRLLAGALVSAGLAARAVESTRLVVTDDQFQNAAPDMAATTAQTHAVLDPLLAAGEIPVTTGFIGATPQGLTTTLGRGGSDYSASILAVALQAREVWIWTDVDGVMTADPRLVPSARTIPELTYLSLIHISSPRDRTRSRMPSSA